MLKSLFQKKSFKHPKSSQKKTENSDSIHKRSPHFSIFYMFSLFILFIIISYEFIFISFLAHQKSKIFVTLSPRMNACEYVCVAIINCDHSFLHCSKFFSFSFPRIRKGIYFFNILNFSHNFFLLFININFSNVNRHFFSIFIQLNFFLFIFYIYIKNYLTSHHITVYVMEPKLIILFLREIFCFF